MPSLDAWATGSVISSKAWCVRGWCGSSTSGASRLGKPRSTFQSRRAGEEMMEVDLVGINGDEVVVVEVKSKLTVDDVRDHLYRMENFKRFFLHNANNRLIGAVAGLVISEESNKFAYRRDCL
jgi:hypothetical protein